MSFTADYLAAPRRKTLPTPGQGGTFDLLLVVVLVLAVWGRTPIGGLADRALHLVFEPDHEIPSLTAYFVTGPPPSVAAIAEDLVWLPDLPAVEEGQLPEPYRTAALRAVGDDLPAAALALETELTDVPEEHKSLYLLDHLYAGDAEAALADFAVGTEQRRRAIHRAIAAGDPDPGHYETWRRYLPAEVAMDGDRVISGTMALAGVLKLTWPIEGEHRISSKYGMRVHPVYEKKMLHNGVDLAVPIGTPVRSAQSGTIVVAAETERNGKYLVIDHGHGLRTAYCHLDSLDVGKDDEVDAGQKVADSGNTGKSTGPHLHFTVRIGKKTVDPLRFHPEALSPVGDVAGPTDEDVASGG